MNDGGRAAYDGRFAADDRKDVSRQGFARDIGGVAAVIGADGASSIGVGSPGATPGRTCPPHYGYSPRVFARAADFEADTLYVIGGLYGNVLALDAIERGATQ